MNHPDNKIITRDTAYLLVIAVLFLLAGSLDMAGVTN